MYKKRFLSMMLAAAFGLSLTVAANAATGEDDHITPGEYANSSDTVIGIAETTVDTGNLSVEIPLYVTMVVVDDNLSEPKILVPGNYYIKNSATTDDGKNPSSDIYVGVSGMTFEKLKGSTYNTVEKGQIASGAVGDLYLALGKVDMPAMDAPGVAEVNIKTVDSVFYDDGTSKVNTVSGGQKIDVAIDAQINTTLDYYADRTQSSDNNTVAQFKVKYTVSAFDKKGQRIAATYVGDDSVQAGLGKWNDAKGEWDISVFTAQGTDHTAGA